MKVNAENWEIYFTCRISDMRQQSREGIKKGLRATAILKL
jgi:hypothetical protein